MLLNLAGQERRECNCLREMLSLEVCSSTGTLLAQRSSAAVSPQRLPGGGGGGAARPLRPPSPQ